jgi:purine-cytosine permease-like protein
VLEVTSASAIFVVFVFTLLVVGLITSRRWLARSASLLLFLVLLFINFFLFDADVKLVSTQAQSAGEFSPAFGLAIGRISDSLWPDKLFLGMVGLGLFLMALKRNDK